MDSGDVSKPFLNICLYLSAPLALVMFCKLSIRKLVFQRSEGINFDTFSTCFVAFVSSVVFDQTFVDFGCHLGLHLAAFFKHTVPTIALTKGSHIKATHFERLRRLPGTPPCVRTSQTRNNSSRTKCCSNLFPLIFPKVARASFANVPTNIQKNEDVKSTLLMI